MNKLNTKKIKDMILPCVGFIIVLLIWHFGVSLTSIGQILPTPYKVAVRFYEVCFRPIGKNYTLPLHLAISLKRVMIGFSLASVTGIVLGIAMGRFSIVNAVLRMIFELVRPIPGVAWIPMAIVWFGVGETAKIFIIFMGAFVNIVVNTYAGSHQVDEKIINVAYMLGANKIQAFFTVIIPYCVPYIFSGMQVGLSTAWMAVLAAEMVAATEGVGWIITAGQQSADMTQVFVGIVAIAITGLTLAGILRLAERLVCSWKVRGM